MIDESLDTRRCKLLDSKQYKPQNVKKMKTTGC